MNQTSAPKNKEFLHLTFLLLGDAAACAALALLIFLFSAAYRQAGFLYALRAGCFWVGGVMLITAAWLLLRRPGKEGLEKTRRHYREIFAHISPRLAALLMGITGIGLGAVVDTFLH